MEEKVVRTDEEWKEILSRKEYFVARKRGTEPPFSGKYYDFKGKGVYRCVACGNGLFSSEAKFDSGSGWPSFWAPVSDESIDEREDKSCGMIRTEVVCRR